MPVDLRKPACVGIMAMIVFAWAPGALGQANMYKGESDAKTKVEVENIFGVYILNPSRRHPKEKVVIKGDLAEVWLFYDQRYDRKRARSETDRIKCRAYRWLLFGRFGENGGARALFRRFPDFNRVDLIFFTLDSKRYSQETRGNFAKYKVEKRPRQYLKIRLSRKRADRLDWKQLEPVLEREGSGCARAGEKAVDLKWYGRPFGMANR